MEVAKKKHKQLQAIDLYSTGAEEKHKKAAEAFFEANHFYDCINEMIYSKRIRQERVIINSQIAYVVLPPKRKSP